MIIGISGKIGNGKDTVGQMIQKLTMNSYQQSPWKIKKFAYKLKQIVSILTGIPVEDLEKQEVKDRMLGKEWERFISLDEVLKNGVGRRPLTVREVLQRVGTEAMRDQLHPNVWVNALMADYKGGEGWTKCHPNLFSTWSGDKFYVPNTENIPEHLRRRESACEIFSWELPPPNWIITDVRFPNEAKAIKDRGGIMLRVNRQTETDRFPRNEHPSETALDDYKFDATIINNGTLEELEKSVGIFLSNTIKQ